MKKQALAIANNTPYGLGRRSGPRTSTGRWDLARRLDVADVWINTHYIRHVETSFGGRHHSGLGRELGMAGSRASLLEAALHRYPQRIPSEELVRGSAA
jgi:acyl-CoA reductase-like NAD-dependent aldehyde dehydrogenase